MRMKSNRNVVLRHTLYIVYRLKRAPLVCGLCGKRLTLDMAHMHHVINRRHLTSEAQEVYPVELCIFLCAECHLGEAVDTPEMRVALMAKCGELFGAERVERARERLSQVVQTDLRRLFDVS